MWMRALLFAAALATGLGACAEPAATAQPKLDAVGSNADALNAVDAASIGDVTPSDSVDGAVEADVTPQDSGDDDLAAVDTANDTTDPGGWRQRTWGGQYNDEAKSVAVATSGGGLWLAGYTESAGAGDWDGLILRTSDCGAVTWARTYGAAKKDELHGIVATTGGGAAAVGVSYSFKGFVEAWVVRVDDGGALVWTASYGGDGFDQASALTETTDADLVVLGETYNFGPGTPLSHNMMLLRVGGKDGKLIWEQTLGGGLDGDAGFALLRTDGPAGNLLVAGATESYGQGRDDIWITKLTPGGKLLWSRAIGGQEDDESRSIAPDGQGGFLLSGFSRTYTTGKSDIFLLRVDAMGTPTWMRHYGNSEKERAYGVVASNGGLLLAGRTLSYGDGDSDAWIMRVKADGAFDWMRLLRGKGDDEIVATAVGPDGGLVFAGRTDSFGAGQRDVWYGRVRADGQAGCNQHTLSAGKVHHGAATPTTLAIQPTIAHGAVRRDVSVSVSVVTTLTSGATCAPTDCK